MLMTAPQRRASDDVQFRDQRGLRAARTTAGRSCATGTGLALRIVRMVFVCSSSGRCWPSRRRPSRRHRTRHRSTPATRWPRWFVGAFLETIADRQQFAFQTAKYASGAKPTKGFLDTGVWAYSRHPNYFAEVLLWWAFYGFAVAATGGLNWSGAGAVCLTILFVAPGASADLTELLSSQKYPAYAEYQKRVSRLVPWLPAADRQPLLGNIARYAFLGYFASHIPITMLIDAQAAIDHRYFPEFAQALLDWHIRVNGDFLYAAVWKSNQASHAVDATLRLRR